MKALLSKLAEQTGFKIAVRPLVTNDKIFSAADLWNIERRKRTRSLRRFI